MRHWWAATAVLLSSLLLGACATKQFEEMTQLDASQVRAMSCEDIEQEFLMLQRHERGVDEEATSGQFEQMLWGGHLVGDGRRTGWSTWPGRRSVIGSVLYEAKLKKDCP